LPPPNAKTAATVAAAAARTMMIAVRPRMSMRTLSERSHPRAIPLSAAMRREMRPHV
jgi:hypothetical protein